jgi:hypothetical protein
MGTNLDPLDPVDSDALAEGVIDAEDARRVGPPEDDDPGLDAERPVIPDDDPEDAPEEDEAPDPPEI